MSKLRSRARLSFEILEGRRLLIVNGLAAAAGEFPAMASIQTARGHNCGGSLIAADWVLTAAHCLGSETQVMVGGTDVSTNNGEVFDVVRAVVHPRFVRSELSDIALLQLSGFSQAEPLDWITEDDQHLAAPGVEATIIGWGRTGVSNSSPSSNVLLKAQLSILDQQVANSPEYFDGSLTDETISAGDADGQTCGGRGDSGGPLLVPNEAGEWMIGGVYNRSRSCTIDVFARPGQYDHWINYYVGDLGVSFDAGGYGIDDAVGFVVRDTFGDDSEFATITTENGDQETIRFSLHDGAGAGSIPASGNEVSIENGILEIADGETLSISYSTLDVNGQTRTATETAVAVVDDHGDSAVTATPIEAGLSLPTSLEFLPDQDWFSFDAIAGARYRFTTGLHSRLMSTSLTVYDSDGNTVLAFNEVDRPTNRLDWTAPRTDKFFVVVAVRSGSYVSGSAELRMFGDRVPYNPDSFEPNDSLQQAVVVTGTLPANIHEPQNDDFYSFTARANGQANVDLRFNSEFGVLEMELLSLDGTVLQRGVKRATDLDERTIAVDVERDVTYIVRVFGDTEIDTNAYTLSMTGPGDINSDGEYDSADLNSICHIVATPFGNDSADITGDGKLDRDDFRYMVTTVLGTAAGDANLDGTFNSSDLTDVFKAGEFEDSLPNNSGWAEGDWNCDREFDSSDLVAAFQAGAYQANAISVTQLSPAIHEFSIALALADHESIVDSKTRRSNDKDTAQVLYPNGQQPKANLRAKILEVGNSE